MVERVNALFGSNGEDYTPADKSASWNTLLNDGPYITTADAARYTPQPSLWDRMKSYAAPATEMWRNSEDALAHANEQFNQRAAGDLSTLMGRHVDPEEMTGVGALIGGVKVPGQRAPVRIENPIKAYHGSPHDFDAFDLSKIGTGEGAQAYGHGLYFAENEGVAQRYRDALAGIADPNTMTAADYAGHHLSFTRMGGEVPEAEARQRSIAMLDAAIQDAKEDASTSWLRRILNRPSATNPLTGQPSAADVPVEKLREARDLIAAGKENPNPQIGRMYEVALHATPEQFLDWDRPLSGQSEAVQSALRAANADEAARPSSAQQMQDRLRWTSRELGEGLSEAGVPGIRYLDQQSRNGISTIGGKEYDRTNPQHQAAYYANRRDLGLDPYAADGSPGALAKADPRLVQAMMEGRRLFESGANYPRFDKGTSNYVVWSPEIIEILRKYGLIPPVAGAAYNALMPQSSQEQ